MAVFEAVTKVLDYLLQAHAKGQEKADETLAALYTALNETRRYAKNLKSKDGEYWANPTAGVVDYAIKHKKEMDEVFGKLRQLMRDMA
jgi:hypothetical protein